MNSTWSINDAADKNLSVKNNISIADKFARKLLFDRLKNLKTGYLQVKENEEVYSFGNPEDSLHSMIVVNNPLFYSKAVLGGNIKIAEAYIFGVWDCSNLTNLFRIFLQNTNELQGFEKIFLDIQTSFRRVFPKKWNHTRNDSKKNILAHYDLGNDFYSIFLDETMTYSSGIFADESATMKEASVEKLDRICRKLDIQPEDHILEIGTGWGSFSLHAAANYGCKITTTTISDEQYKLARARIEEAGLSNKITVLNKDYRDLNSTFDKIVSIEMIEAVGHEQIPKFAKKLDKLLKPGGQIVIQGITIRDQVYDSYRLKEDFIKRYIFPGGNLLSTSYWQNEVSKNTSLSITGLEEIGLHYARTLREWRSTFFHNIDQVKDLGFSDKFIRMWEYYLTYCEGGFLEKHIGTVQITMEKPLHSN